jgi:hypothetical protein
MIPLRRTCREVAALLVAREDRHLGLADRLALRLHLAACEACPKFERQLLTMRNGMRLWRGYTTFDAPNSPENSNSSKN